MIAVGTVQVAIDEIIDMVTMRHRLVPTTGAVLMTDLVTAAIMVGRAALRVLRTDFQDMVLNERRASGAQIQLQSRHFPKNSREWCRSENPYCFSIWRSAFLTGQLLTMTITFPHSVQTT